MDRRCRRGGDRQYQVVILVVEVVAMNRSLLCLSFSHPILAVFEYSFRVDFAPLGLIK